MECTREGPISKEECVCVFGGGGGLCAFKSLGVQKDGYGAWVHFVNN